MNRYLNFCTKIFAVFTLSATMLMTALPVAAVEIQEYDPLSILDDNNIPVVYINIDETADGFSTIQEMNESPDHSAKCTGTVRIDVPDGYTGDYSDIVLDDTDELQLEYIRGRGNVTWLADKKAYKFKLDKKAPLLGMGKNKHWALLANRYDASLIRNRIVSYIGSQFGMEYTPKMLPVDLVINGDYAGSYFLAETVRIGKDRVNIDELTEDDNSEPAITGGYLVALLNILAPAKPISYENTFTTEQGVSFWFEEPEFYSDDGGKIGTSAQFQYIKSYLQNTENAIFSPDFTDENGIPCTDYMDWQSTADFWWIQEIVMNYDAYDTTSNYLYKKRDGKLYWGPLWDFDYSMGLYRSETEGFNRTYHIWTDHLRAYNADFRQLLKDRWKVLDPIITEVIRDGGVIDQYVAEQENSAQDELLKWGNSPVRFHPPCGFRGEAEFIKNWLSQRQNWINEHIDTDLDKVFCNVTFMADGQVVDSYTLEKVPVLRTLPTPPVYENKTFIGWADENGEFYTASNAFSRDDDKIIDHDIVLTAIYENSSEESEISELSEIPEISEISEVSEVSQISEISEVSEVSQISEISEVSEVSQISEISEISEVSELSEISHSSVNADDKSTEHSYVNSHISSNSTHTDISDNIPDTGDSSHLLLFLAVSALSVSAIAVVNKKRKNNS